MISFRSTAVSKVFVGIGVLSLIVGVSRCASPDASSSVSPTTPTRALAKPSGTSAAIAPAAVSTTTTIGTYRPLTANRANAVNVASHLAHASATVAWMAEVHTAAMQELVPQRGRLRAVGKGATCAALELAVRHQLPRIMRETHVTDSQTYEDAISSGLANVHCAVPKKALSVWTVPSVSLAMTDSTVTGSYTAYSSALESAISDASSADDAASRLDAVVASASSLGYGDFQALSGIASASAASVYYWDAIGPPSGGGGGGGDSIGLSVFKARATMNCGFGCVVGYADLAGSLAGAWSVLSGSGGSAIIAWPTLLAGAVIGMVLSSGGAAVGY